VLDLTGRNRAEAGARESERRYREIQIELAHAHRLTMMGHLTTSIAHEVTQPIAAMAINAQAALRWLTVQRPDLEEVRQALARIVHHGKRASEVIGRIRALITKAPPHKDRFEINAAIREVIELTRSEAVKHQISVHTQLAEGLPLIEEDRVQLQQVILNLLINALEALSNTDGRRELQIITGHADSGGVLVTVRDWGPGLAPSISEHLFEPFCTTKSSGLGPGLSICQSVIEAHGGQLWAEANVPHGATFRFAVPAQRNSS
jgi:C4-dicarboxylate-specific signal transduction histidine kinase